jgi:hypothetical protein
VTALGLSVMNSGTMYFGKLNAVTDQELALQIIPTKTELELELLYDWRFTANHFVLVTSPLRLTTSKFIFQLNICGYNSYATSSLTR